MLKLRPCSLQSSSKNVSIFYEREQVFAEITGAEVYRGVGSGSPMCLYRLYGSNVYVDKMKALVESLIADGHYNQCNSDFAQ